MSGARRIRRPLFGSSQSSSIASRPIVSPPSTTEESSFNTATTTTSKGFDVDSLDLNNHSHYRQQERKSSTSKTKLKSMFLFYLRIISVLLLLWQQVPSGLISSLWGMGKKALPEVALVKKSLASRLRGGRPHPQGLPTPGELAPVRQNPKQVIPFVMLRNSPQSEYHIFVLGQEGDTATVVLTNAIIGLFEGPEQFVATLKWSTVTAEYLSRHQNDWVADNTTAVSQTFETDVVQLEREFRLQYGRLFFFALKDSSASSTDNPCLAPMESRMVCVTREELYYESPLAMQKVVAKLVKRIKTELPSFSAIDFDTARTLQRLAAMDDMVAQMHELPATTFETKYGVSGGVRITG